MLQQIRAQTTCCNSNGRPVAAAPAPITRPNLRSQASSCKALPSSRPDTQQTLGAGAVQFAAAAAAAALVLWPVQAAQALPEAQLEHIKQAIDKDFQQGQYYVTGNLTADLYDPSCRFKDPTTDVKGVEPYTKAVAALFDPEVSKADLLSSSVSGPNSITLRWRLEGRLKIGQLPIKPYTGTTVYTVDESSGKITGHTETWDISALDAFVSTLIPSFGAPPAPPVAQ